MRKALFRKNMWLCGEAQLFWLLYHLVLSCPALSCPLVSPSFPVSQTPHYRFALNSSPAGRDLIYSSWIEKFHLTFLNISEFNPHSSCICSGFKVSLSQIHLGCLPLLPYPPSLSFPQNRSCCLFSHCLQPGSILVWVWPWPWVWL